MEALAAGHKLHVQPRRSANHEQRLFTRRTREPFWVLRSSVVLLLFFFPYGFE